MKNILNISQNAKTVKGEKYGYLTGILYLAPSDISGYQVCPMAKIAKCENACLYTAGRGGMNNVQLARIAKTKRFFEDYDNFMNDLIFSINHLIRKAKKLNLIPLVRLNGTSDILWEKKAFTMLGKKYNNLMEYFPDVQFYDYSKIANRKNLPTNYDITFSYSGALDFIRQVQKAQLNNLRIAAVFRSIDVIPSTFLDRPVISGDNSDIRHTEPKNSIVALYAKGQAKKDTTGFVIN